MPAPAAPTRSRETHGTGADLALLRTDAALRARCAAAVLVPFALYAVVMLIVGAHGVRWLLWIWIPTITAGVVVGALLDRAHRRATSAAVAPPHDPAGVSGS